MHLSYIVIGLLGLVVIGLGIALWRARRVPTVKTLEEADRLVREFAAAAPAGDADLQAIIKAYGELKRPDERKAMARFITETFGNR
jgi:hypothetical protein